MHGIRLCRERGIKVGVRYTMTEGNAHDRPRVLKLVEDEAIDKFFSHLELRRPRQQEPRRRRPPPHHPRGHGAAFETCLDLHRRGIDKDFVTGNNDADGPFLLHWVQRRFPDKAAHIEARLRQWGGNASG